MKEKTKRFLYPVILPIVIFLILYTMPYITEPGTSTIYDMPIYFQIVIVILLYLGGIAICIRSGILGWDKI
jgi:hypothetical protein